MTGNEASPTLHVLNKSPGHTRASACLGQLAPGDTLMLIEDAVLGLVDDGWLGQLPEGITLSALEPDMALRGLRSADFDGVCSIDYGGFVSLVCQHARNVHW